MLVTEKTGSVATGFLGASSTGVVFRFKKKKECNDFFFLNLKQIALCLKEWVKVCFYRRG